MSIIYDALTKTQQHREETRETEEIYEAIEQPFVASSSLYSFTVPWKRISILLMSGLFIYAGFSFTIYRTTAASLKHFTAMPFYHEANYQTAMNLKGVFLSNHDKAVLVDNRFYRIGEAVNGMTVVDINEDHVKLQTYKGILTFPVPKT